MSDRPYLYYELTNSVCTTCYRKVEAKIVLQDDRVYMHKRCPHHGFEKVLISTDIEYYKRSRLTLKPGQLPVYAYPVDSGSCFGGLKGWRGQLFPRP